ncbi:SAM-dependent methyltransferase [Pseudarthrobacter phenanthrenivorans]|uniref:spermidine synthase n=1 Tax=Pseudarthrobacter phenanthrenivorans TaxID=361575 RepID=UPI001126D265|nr:fused MFS/spermidine synthase [Pseudarthrobacter phenanthrenivorans]TPV49019.1 SAM-dependent methyltransferase [Pseudarthrobacter phenanthrenivorans]
MTTGGRDGRATRFLRTTGQHASIEPDPFTGGSYVLSIGGAEQSHVNLAQPEEIFYEYLRRIGHLVDLAAPAGTPVTALHLGAGALTLARYIQATRPGSVQYAVELERELLDFVLRQLPLPEGTDLQTVIGDARESLSRLDPALLFDVVILDIFSGPDAPAHLASSAFYREVRERLSPSGLLIVNVGDEPGLTLVRSQVAAMRAAMPDVAAVAEAGMFEGRYPGNIVLAGTQVPWPQDWTAELTARGPHPARVATGVDLDPFAG